MFVVYGRKAFRKDLGYTHKVYHCPNCNNNKQYLVMRNRKFFTLYWIPLIPYSSKYYVTCPVCGAGYEVKKADALGSMQPEQVVVEAQPNTTYLNGTPYDSNNSNFN